MCIGAVFFFLKQKTAYEMRISDWSSDVCSSDLRLQPRQETAVEALESAMRSAREEGRLRHATALADLRDGLLARLTPRDALRAEADVEAVLMAMGSVTHPGPRVSLKIGRAHV